MTSSLKEFYIGIRLFYCLFKILHHLIVTLILESDSLMHFFFLIYKTSHPFPAGKYIVYETEKAALWKESQSRMAQLKQKVLSSPGLPLSALCVHGGLAIPPPPITPVFQAVRARNRQREHSSLLRGYCPSHFPSSHCPEQLIRLVKQGST